MIPELQEDKAVIFDEKVDELPQVGILGDTLLHLKIEAFRTIGCEIVSIENGFHSCSTVGVWNLGSVSFQSFC